MGTSIGTYSYMSKKGKNPFEDAIGRNEAGELTVDLSRVLDRVGTTSTNKRYVDDMMKALGSGPVRASDFENYSASYQGTTGGDADMLVNYTWSPLKGNPLMGGSGGTKQAYRSAVEAFKIKEQGQKEAARIAQEGRDKARQANFGAELDSINRRALAASEDNSYEQVGGNPDVVLSTDTDADEAPVGQGRDSRRRRSAFFSGGGLLI